MEPYSFLLWLGFGGLVLMAVLGAAGGHGHNHHASHGAHAQGFHLHESGHQALNLHAHATHHHGAAPTTSAHPTSIHGHGHAHSPPSSSSGAKVLSWLSPRVAFAVALGAGATGILATPYLSVEPARALVAIAGGIGLEKLAVAPMWSLLMRFASTPARTLESAVWEEATALTNFDRDGCGLVSIVLDGHEMRVLARLQPEENDRNVRAGDLLLVEDVDATRGQCRVSKI